MNEREIGSPKSNDIAAAKRRDALPEKATQRKREGEDRNLRKLGRGSRGDSKSRSLLPIKIVLRREATVVEVYAVTDE